MQEFTGKLKPIGDARSWKNSGLRFFGKMLCLVIMALVDNDGSENFAKTNARQNWEYSVETKKRSEIWIQFIFEKEYPYFFSFWHMGRHFGNSSLDGAFALYAAGWQNIFLIHAIYIYICKWVYLLIDTHTHTRIHTYGIAKTHSEWDGKW